MSNFVKIAEPLAKMGIPLTPVRPGTKRAFLENFPALATCDLDQIYTWDAQFPDHNVACVARPEDGGVWFWEVDSPDVLARILTETGHDAAKEIITFKVRSRPGRGHFYFRHNAASKELGNISQSYVVGQDWSARTDGQYVVGPGSIHPDTGAPYEALNWGTSIAEAPQWLLDWLRSQKISKHSAPTGAGVTSPGDNVPRDVNGLVPHGAIHGWMLTQAGRLRSNGMTQEEIEPVLLRLVHENCAPPIDDSKVVQMAKSICNFPPTPPSTSLVLNQGAGTGTPPPPPEPEEEIDYSDSEYPLFPRNVMFGTSIYENFVKPYCEKNSRIDYFMWMPTAIMMMNYLGTKTKVPFKSWKPSFFLVMIGEKGRTHKSSSMKDGIEYLKACGVIQMYSKEIKTSDGKTTVWEAGSPEGLGIDMQRINSKNAVLLYDELSSLVAKASIEGSGMSAAMLKMYESNTFSNTIKDKKSAFAVEQNTYIASLITATTDQRFLELWAKFAKKDTGLNERFTFALQPETLPDEELEAVVPYNETQTKAFIAKAVNKVDYQFFDQTPFKQALKLYGTRTEIRAEKWALYFAIDLGLDEIDEDCVERGIAMAKYEHEVRNWLKTYESENVESTIQQDVIRHLKKFKGKLQKRELERALHVERYGTTIWFRAYSGLIKSGYIGETGLGVKGNPLEVLLLRDMKFKDDYR